MKLEKLNTLLIFGSILKQSTKYLSSTRLISTNHVNFRIIYILIIFTWIVLLAVFTYIFSCSIILSQIKLKPVKFVESIQDVVQNSKLNVAGSFVLRLFPDNQELMIRAKEYEKKMEIEGNPNTNFITKDILNDILTGKAIVLANSLIMAYMMDSYQEYNLVSAKMKYGQIYMVHLISKNHRCSTQITNA